MQNILNTVELKQMSSNRKSVLDIATDLAILIDEHKDKISESELDRFISMALVGITFSLWRAVPLVHTSQKPSNIVESSSQYLDRIIRHNAITYGDDDQKRFWSFGYYMGNARYRITELCSGWVHKSWSEGLDDLDSELVIIATTHRKPGDDPSEKLKEYIKITQSLMNSFSKKLI